MHVQDSERGKKKSKTNVGGVKEEPQNTYLHNTTVLNEDLKQCRTRHRAVPG